MSVLGWGLFPWGLFPWGIGETIPAPPGGSCPPGYHPSPGWGMEPWGETAWGGTCIADPPGPPGPGPNFQYQPVPKLWSGPTPDRGLAPDPALSGY